MCGRFTEAVEAEKLAVRFRADFEGAWGPRYNIAPSQLSPVILNYDPKHIVSGYWGYAPPWIKKTGKGKLLINIRAESILTKPIFTKHFTEHRCLVLADGFYEWQKDGKNKIPYHIVRQDREPFAFAGIWQPGKSKTGKKLPLFAIVTVQPNELMKPIHNRMPAMLLPESEALWLAETTKPEDAKELLQPYPDKELEAYPISTAVNNPANDSEKVIERV